MLRLYLSAFLTMTGVAFVLPVLPRWLERAGADHTVVGAVVTLSMGAGLLLARPIAGRLTEGRARVPVIACGLVVSAAACALYPAGLAAAGPLGVALARGLHGMGFALVEVAALSLIVDLAPPEKRGQSMGYFGALVALSLVVGPVAGGAVAAAWNDEATFYCAAAGALLGLAPLPGLVAARPAPALPGRLGEALRVPGMPALAAGHFLTMTVHGCIIAFLPLRLPQDAPVTAEGFLALFAAVVIGTRVAIGRRFDLWPRRLFTTVGALGMGLAGLGIAAFDAPAGLYAAAIAYGVGLGVYLPGASARVGDLAPEHVRARAFSLFTLAFDFGFLAAGPLFGPISEARGPAAAFAAAALGPALGIVAHLAARPAREPGG